MKSKLSLFLNSFLIYLSIDILPIKLWTITVQNVLHRPSVKNNCRLPKMLPTTQVQTKHCQLYSYAEILRGDMLHTVYVHKYLFSLCIPKGKTQLHCKPTALSIQGTIHLECTVCEMVATLSHYKWISKWANTDKAKKLPRQLTSQHWPSIVICILPIFSCN